MFTNIGKVERAIRVVLGVVLLFLTSRSPWFWFGLLPLLTGITGFCPLYRVLGISTAGKNTLKHT